VRIIRDKDTFIGKGIGYVMFSTKEEMKNAIETKNKSNFRVSHELNSITLVLGS
jgi:RNA recognition motif-containing protein